MKDLEGRVAVVAGATRGAGRSTTNFFSGNGVSVTMHWKTERKFQ